MGRENEKNGVLKREKRDGVEKGSVLEGESSVIRSSGSGIRLRCERGN
jgi:hypothetical protein